MNEIFKWVLQRNFSFSLMHCWKHFHINSSHSILENREENASVINEGSKQGNVAKSINPLAQQSNFCGCKSWNQLLQTFLLQCRQSLTFWSWNLGTSHLHWAEGVRRKDPFDQKWLHFTNCYAIILCLKISGLGGAMLLKHCCLISVALKNLSPARSSLGLQERKECFFLPSAF